MHKIAVKFVFLFSMLLSSLVWARQDTHIIEKESKSQTTAVLEFFTSEGCSSCPPAEKYVKQIVKQHSNSKQFIPLAFHVDYWDYIGWEDIYAQPEHGKRQRQIAMRNRLATIYTPQFVLDGVDFRAYLNIPRAIGKINQAPAQAKIRIRAGIDKHQQLKATIAVNALNERSQAYSDIFIAITEDNLVSRVTEGENEGLQLEHSHVVRKLIGPYKMLGKQKTINEVIKLEKTWKRSDLSLVVFVQDRLDGSTHQALQAPLSLPAVSR